MHNFIDGGAHQLKAHHQDQKGNSQRGDIFNSAVAKWVFVIRRTIGGLEAEKRHGRGARVGEVVDRVRRDGDAVGERADQKFCNGQQKVAGNPHRAAENAES